MRKHKFIVGEYYHIYNRGVDKRKTFLDQYDLNRFLKCLVEFNTKDPIGSIYELSFQKQKFGSSTTKSKLVSIIAYCVNPNHFHLLLTPLTERGIEKFMQKIGGYTRYFNEKHKRNGALFQGKFKSKHIPDNNYLLRLSTYINMNNRDSFGNPTTKLSKSSLEEYSKNIRGLCNTKIASRQFKDSQEYLEFAIEAWKDSRERKKVLEMDQLGNSTTKSKGKLNIFS
jgi:REP element-mobilizing transposase RayT